MPCKKKNKNTAGARARARALSYHALGVILALPVPGGLGVLGELPALEDPYCPELAWKFRSFLNHMWHVVCTLTRPSPNHGLRNANMSAAHYTGDETLGDYELGAANTTMRFQTCGAVTGAGAGPAGGCQTVGEFQLERARNLQVQAYFGDLTLTLTLTLSLK